MPILIDSLRAIGISSILGYILFKGTQGTDDDLYKTFQDKNKENSNSYDKNKMFTEILRGGGRASLSELREETTKKRLKIAEENTVYNVPVQKKEEK